MFSHKSCAMVIVQFYLCSRSPCAGPLVEEALLQDSSFCVAGLDALAQDYCQKTSIASASIFFIFCFLLSLLRNAFVTKLKECSNHDEILYICCLVFEILLLVSCVRAPEDFFARVLQ